jgi:hypothetical protein
MENGHPVLRVKRSSIDRDWMGRTDTEGFRILREKPVGSPNFVAARQIEPSQLASLNQLFPLLPDRNDVFEWQSIREDSTFLVKGPPEYMTEVGFNWINEESLNVHVILTSLPNPLDYLNCIVNS